MKEEMTGKKNMKAVFQQNTESYFQDCHQCNTKIYSMTDANGTENICFN